MSGCWPVSSAVPFLLGRGRGARRRDAGGVTFQDPDIVESSGRRRRRRRSSSPPTTPATPAGSSPSTRPPARPSATTEVGLTPTDVEALAPVDDDQVWVGDIGDNQRARDSVQVTPVPVGPGTATTSTGRSTTSSTPTAPHDAETLMRDPATGRLYVATKGVLGGTLYAAPEAARPPTGPTSSSRWATCCRSPPTARSCPTAGTRGPQLRGRPRSTRSRRWRRSTSFRLPDQEQGEGIAVDDRRAVSLSSEGVHTDVLRVRCRGPAARPPVSSPTVVHHRAVSPPRHDVARPARTESRGATEPARDQATSGRLAGPWLLGGVVALSAVCCWSVGPEACRGG